MNIKIAHIQAGDISGGLDNIHRHAITKLAHLHFSQNSDQKKRVLKLGEEKKKNYDIIIIGTPPTSHLQLALSAIEESPKAILVEKPLSEPNLQNIQAFSEVYVFF